VRSGTIYLCASSYAHSLLNYTIEVVARMSTEKHSFGSRYMSGNEVRQQFLDFFTARGHKELPSSSLVPHNDPTVLLTTAGMQQMTPYFLGLEAPPTNRLCSVQKCFRTVDIDEVGDESHCTFFFMLGNFSVGDYFKKQSLAWTWEFLTETMGLPGDRLYPTVHPDDEDAYAIWRDEVGVPQERIGKLEDNWWGPVGPTGPNGPDSEVYFDRGEEHGCGLPTCAPGCDCERFLEVWNNVFMEFFQNPDGSRTPLPRKNVDTGMGLERLTMLMQAAKSIYGTDLYQAIIQRAAALAGTTYGIDEENDVALRIIADHTRGATFLISDGVLPGNEGRSYVLRRIVRRAIRNGRKLGLDKPFLADMAGVVIEQFGDHYPNLRERRSQIERVLTHEEESFGRTLTTGMNRFQALAANLIDEGRTVVPGEEAFRLYDTYGFPYDLTVELAREQSLTVDQTGFDAAMDAQRAASRGGAAFRDAARNRAELYVSLGGRTTEFLGYDEVAADATVLALVGPNGALDEAEAGQAVEVILDRTPFYGEAGGQIGDTGQIRTETGVIDVEDTFKPTPDLFVHRGVVAEGFVRPGEEARAEIDAARRQAIRRNHTATHLLHRALRIVLGEETHQAGSLVAPDRLRFDFTSLDPMQPEQIVRVSEIVNREIITNEPVTTERRAYKDAVEAGAMALFGEKYGDVVRVVTVPGFSQELCGGTHVSHIGEIGPFLIVSEGSVAAGIRRIEALTGEAAINRMLSQQQLVDSVAHTLRVPWSEIPAQVNAIQDRVRSSDREAERLRGQIAGARAGDLLDQAVSVDGARVLSARVDVENKDDLRQMGDRIRDRLDSGVIVLGTVLDGQPRLLSMVTSDLVSRGVRAGDIVRKAAAIIDGRGGGRPELAEAGGKDSSKLDTALSSIPDIVKEAIG
jgi:alanyl-tRNA synthetase